ncbi:MAG: hypothetical protein WCS28_12705 [Thiomicrospira sp.]|jgi:hypothetical protein
MRLEKIVTLDDAGRFATVRELTVAEVRQLLSEHCLLKQVPTLELLTSHHGEAKAVLQDAIELPNDEALDDLPLSELLQISEAFVQLNQALFQLAAAKEQVAAETQDRPSSN